MTLDTYPLCLGGNTFGWTSTRDQSWAVLDDYCDAGGNFIDTADAYSAWVPGNEGGESETIIGEWLAQGHRQRGDLVIATKVGKWASQPGLAAANIVSAVEGSLRRLQTDYIDLYYAHAEDPNTPLEETQAALAQLIEAGKIRAIGLSNFSAETLAAWPWGEGVDPVALQPHYNLLSREPYETELRPLVVEHGLAVMPYYALAGGLLTGKYDLQAPLTGDRAATVERYVGSGTEQKLANLRAVADEHNVEPAAVAVAWLSAQPTVTAPIASARVPEQLPPLLEGISIVLSDEDLQLLGQ